MKQTNTNKFFDSSDFLSIDFEARKLYNSSGTQIFDWTTSVGSGGIASTRQVYLVNNSTDQSTMGGTSNNVYITAQAAYDAADTLQQALGGSNIVVIMVGRTDASTVGNITLAADWNKYVYVAGINPTVSSIGNIVATHATTKGFDVGTLDGGSGISYPLYMSNVNIGNITTNYTGTMTGVEQSGNVTLALLNCIVGGIDTSINDPGLKGSQAGILSINFDPLGGTAIVGTGGSIVGDLVATSQAAVPSLYVYNLYKCGHVTGSVAVDTDTSNITIENIQYIVGDVVGSDTTMTRVENMNGNITAYNSLSITYSGVFTTTISIAANATYVAIAHVDFINTINISALQSTSSPLTFVSVGEISSFTVANTSGGAAATHPVIVTNCLITTLNFSNTTFGNTALVTKSTSSYIATVTKTVWKKYSGDGLSIDIAGIAAGTSTAINATSGTAQGLDNSKFALTELIVINTTANAVTGGLKIGTASGGSQVVSALTVGANATLYIDDTSILQRLFTTVPTSLFIAAVTSFNSAVLNVSFVFKTIS